MKLRMMALAALLTSLTLPAMATTQASLSLSDFGITLKDLKPGDGIAASLNWSSYLPLLSTTGTDASQLGWDPSLSMSTWSSGTETHAIQFSTGALDTVTMYGHGTQHVAQSDSGLDSMTLTAYAEAGQQVESGASMYRAFTLSAGTQVTFSLTVDGSWSGTAYTGSTSPSGGSWMQLSNSGISVAMLAGSLNATTYGTGSSTWPYATDGYDSSMDGQVLKLTLKNNSAADKFYTLDVIGRVNAQEVAAPVPEPSSYAMLGAGLLLLGAVARRRKA